MTLRHLAIVEWSLFTKKLHQLSWHRVFWALHPLQAAVTFLLGTLGVAVRTWAQRRKEDRALTWPIADAVIQAVRVRPKDGYWVKVEYRFFARDEYRYGKFRRHFRKKTKAEAFAAAVRNLSVRVPVH